MKAIDTTVIEVAISILKNILDAIDNSEDDNTSTVITNMVVGEMHHQLIKIIANRKDEAAEPKETQQ